MLTPLQAQPAAAQSGSGLEPLGLLSVAGHEGPVAGSSAVLGINEEARRLYTAVAPSAGEYRVGVYDLDTEIPTLLHMTEPFLPTTLNRSPSAVVVDPAANRMILLAPAPVGTGTPNLLFVDLDEDEPKLTDQWELTESVPGFVPLGMTYDSALDRFYLVGKFDGNVNMTQGGALGGTGMPSAGIVALDGEDGDFLWAHVLGEQCESLMRSNTQGTVLGLSAHRPLLYTFCAPGSTAFQPTGQGGLVRVDISEQSNASDLADFPQEFFPVSGKYDGVVDTGVAGFDPLRERFYAHSLSHRTHGAWVFDGLASAWVGFIAALDAHNKLLGIDPKTGKHYMAGNHHDGLDEDVDKAYVNVTSGGATPVPQGQTFNDLRLQVPSGREARVQPWSDMAIDGPTGRVFGTVRWQVTDDEKRSDFHSDDYGFAVLRDNTPLVTPRSPLDLDELTHDLPDDEARLELSANTAGFGAQYIQVGGWENVYTRPTIPFFESDLRPFIRNLYPGIDNPAAIRYGNRGATMSLVEQIGIASSGSSATAIATRPDDNTPADAETKQDEATDPVGGVPSVGDDEDGEEQEAEEAEYATCLDGIGETVTEEKGSEDEPAHAVVVCDLANLETTAHARFSGGSGGGGMIVSDSSFDGRTFRDPERGVVTETEAVAEGIFFGEADVGGVGIDRVTSTATTWAKGLDGESHVRWVRTVEGARTFDADGTASEPESCTTTVESGKEVVEEGDCESLQKDLNELMPTRFEVKFPLPEIVATPGGAFASVQETESDFLSGQATYNDERRVVPGMEMTVFADGSQRGRLWVQLAAVKADATFIRSPIQTFEPFDTSVDPVDTTATGDTGPNEPAAIDEGDSGPAEEPDSDGTAVAAPVTPEEPEVASDEEQGMTMASHEARLVGGFGWVPALRSLGDAVLTGALYLVFLLPVAEIVRRRRLLDVLSDTAPADVGPSAAGSRVPLSVTPVRSTS